MSTTAIAHESRPNTLAVCRAVGWVSFLEIIRDKILYNILVLALLLLGLGFVASRLTFAWPDRIIMDFGLLAINLSGAMISIFLGSNVIIREFDRRTILVALSHPISRFQFLLGKFTGVVMVLFVNWFLFSMVFLLILGLSSRSFGDNLHGTLFWALGLLLFQGMLLAAVAMMFSTFSTTSLSAILTIGVYLVGSNVSQIRFLATKLDGTALASMLRAAAGVLPNIEHFNLGTKVTYGLPVSFQLGAYGVAYGILVTAMFIALAGVLIHGKDN